MARTIEERDFSGRRAADGSVQELTVRYWLRDTLADGTVVYLDRRPRRKHVVAGDPALTQATGRDIGSGAPNRTPLETALNNVRRTIEAEEGIT